MMRWLLSSLILTGAIAAVTEDLVIPLHYARNAHLFHYQENDLLENYQLDEIADSCLSPFMEIEDRCLYYNTTDRVNWTSAQKACEDINGNLIEISIEEQDPLSEYLHNVTVDSYILGAFWTGGNDKQEEDDWVWLSGNPVNGSWGEDENNNNTDENCLMLDTRNAVYRDNRCDFPWPYLCEPGPCYNNPCGINAHCDVVDYVNFNCTCDIGYEGDANTNCTEIDPCDEGECGDNAVCIAETWDRFHCECEEGYVGDPDTACEYDPCYNITCGDNAECEKLSNSTAECRCKLGYTGNPEEGCTEIDPCDKGQCGEHAVCIKETWDKFHCECEEGYVGDPDTACDSDPCYQVTCGSHASCYPKEQDHECRCDDGYPHGDPNVECSGGIKSVCSSWPVLLLTLSMTILIGHRNES